MRGRERAPRSRVRAWGPLVGELGVVSLPVELCSPPQCSLPLLFAGRPANLGFAGDPRPGRRWRPELSKEAAEPGLAGRCGR